MKPQSCSSDSIYKQSEQFKVINGKISDVIQEIEIANQQHEDNEKFLNSKVQISQQLFGIKRKIKIAN